MASKRTEMLAIGGPYDRQVISLYNSGNTMSFRVFKDGKSWVGRYVYDPGVITSADLGKKKYLTLKWVENG